MRALVDDAAELMLRGADRDNRNESRRNIPPPAEARSPQQGCSSRSCRDRRDDDEIDEPYVGEIRIVVALFELPNGLAAAQTFGARVIEVHATPGEAGGGSTANSDSLAAEPAFALISALRVEYSAGQLTRISAITRYFRHQPAFPEYDIDYRSKNQIS